MNLFNTHPVLAKNEKCKGGTKSLKVITSRSDVDCFESNIGLGLFWVSSHHSTSPVALGTEPTRTLMPQST